MFQVLGRIWWLLGLCGIVDAMCATTNLLMLNPDASLSLRGSGPPSAVWDMSVLALVAGACAIIAGLSNRGKGNSWLLSVHGLALGAFGLIGVSPLVRGPLSFRLISLLFLLMALSAGAFSLVTAQTERIGTPDRWFLNLSGVVSICFAFSFIAIGFGWVRLGLPHSFWIWMSSYFGFCAIFMLYLALRVRSQGVSRFEPKGSLSTIPNPRDAH